MTQVSLGARRADASRITKRLVAQLERLGHTVTLQTSTAQAAAPSGAAGPVVVEDPESGAT